MINRINCLNWPKHVEVKKKYTKKNCDNQIKAEDTSINKRLESDDKYLTLTVKINCIENKGNKSKCNDNK